MGEGCELLGSQEGWMKDVSVGSQEGWMEDVSGQSGGMDGGCECHWAVRRDG